MQQMDKSDRTMRNLRRAELWAGLLLIVLLVVLSVTGAFYGADRAKKLFNSPPLAVFWVAFTVLMTLGMLTFRRLRGESGLLLIHAGLVLVLVGSMWGSEAGHQLQKQFLGIEKIPAGYMVISEGQSENRIMANDLQTKLAQMPFEIHLRDFKMDYYWQHGKLYIQSRRGWQEQMPAQAGLELDFSDGLGSIRILRVFKNFRIDIKQNERVVSDDPDSGENPALEVQITGPDGMVSTGYVFERFPPEDYDRDGLRLVYVLMPRDYFSDLTVTESGRERVQKTIEVNKPLHYGGYYFYQADYDHQNGRYTILSVTSDTGQPLVFTGYLLMGVGLFWHFWLRPAVKFLKTRKKIEYGNC
jgi:hypothetical protein